MPTPPPSSSPSPLHGVAAAWYGAQPFDVVDALNRADAAACRDGAAARIRVFTPAMPTLTLGRRVHNPEAAGLAETIARCRAAGVAVVPVDRGGQATLHLPGQIVALVAIPCTKIALSSVVTALLDGAEEVARQHDLQPTRGHGADAGLWIGARKLTSIGLRHTHGVVHHGVAVNAAIETALSRDLTLCGRQGAGYADLMDGGALVKLPKVAEVLMAAWGCRIAPCDLGTS